MALTSTSPVEKPIEIRMASSSVRKAGKLWLNSRAPVLCTIDALGSNVSNPQNKSKSESSLVKGKLPYQINIAFVTSSPVMREFKNCYVQSTSMPLGGGLLAVLMTAAPTGPGGGHTALCNIRAGI